MGDDADAKWHRALLKKLRSAVAVKTRVDAGDAASLQKSQAGKGTKRAIDDALHALKQAGLGRDSPLVRAAFEAGAREGKTAMEKAAKRGPDGGADGVTPSKKRLKREARAEAYAEGGGGGGEANGSTKSSSRSRDPRASRDPTTNEVGPRNPHVSGHVFAACKRAVYALHALAKEPEEKESARESKSSYVSRFAAAAGGGVVAGVARRRRRRAPRGGRAVVAREDQPQGDRHHERRGHERHRRQKKSEARTTANDAPGGDDSRDDDDDCRGDVFFGDLRLRAVRRRRTYLGRARCRDRGLVRRQPLYALALVPGPIRRGARRGKGAAAAQRGGGGGRPAGRRKRAVGVRASARRRRQRDRDKDGRRFGGTDCSRTYRNEHENETNANPREMSAALWALATLQGDGLCPDAGAVAAPLAAAAGAAARETGRFTPRCVGDAAWACGKLLCGEDPKENSVDKKVYSEHKKTFVSAVSSLALAARVLVEDEKRLGLFPPRNLANALWACAASRVDKKLAEPLAAAFFATATAAGRADAERKRRAVAKEAGTPRMNSRAGGSSAEENDFSDDEVSFEDAKPSPDDIASAVEAVALLRLETVDPDRIRAAVSSALTVPAGGARGIGWRAAGRLEHATFAALGCGPARSTVTAEDENVSKRDCEVLRRLLRRGAAAAEEADAERLTLEEGASHAMLAVLDTIVTNDDERGSERSILCVDDTQRLLSKSLRDRRWKVTAWNRFGRGERVGSAWPSVSKTKFDAATVRYPPTRAAAEMALAAAAARTKPGAPVWIYGARLEGVFGAARDGKSFRDVSVVFVSPCGGFAVVKATRAAEDTKTPHLSDDEDEDVSRFRTVTTLTLPSSDSTTEKTSTETVENWSVYPGLFAGGGLDVMTAALLRAMPDRFPVPEKSSENETPFAVLDYCAGSGVLAAAVRRRVPSDAALTLTDADAVALRAARENFASLRRGAMICASDGFSGLAPRATFDLIVSNPPVHLGLQPEFTVLRRLARECVERLNAKNPHASCWFVAQRYVPVASICADADVEARCVFSDDRFAVWKVARSRLLGGEGAESPGKQKKQRKEKKEKKASSEKEKKKSSKKEKKDKEK
jgi:16S rRNA G1207 methylase RsmC